MQPSGTRSHLTLFTLLLVSMKSADGVKMNMERRLADSLDPTDLGSLPVEYPCWECILREFLFKTISLPSSSNVLYKEILEAPLYARPFSASAALNDRDGHETVQVLSHDHIHHLAKGGLCNNHEIPTVQKMAIVPTVRWILRGIEGLIPFAYPKKHDLHLTVLPQNDGIFHTKSLSPGPCVHATSKNGAPASFTDTLDVGGGEYSLHYPLGTAESPASKTPGDLVSSIGNEDEELDRGEVWTEGPKTDEEVFQMTSTLIPKTKGLPTRERGREILRGESNLEVGYPNLDFDQENSAPPTTPKSIDYNFERNEDAVLILGRDQFGEKHLVHVVPAGQMDQRIKWGRMHSGLGLLHQQLAHPHPVYTEQQGHFLYRKIFQRVIDSLTSHKDAIEKFLLSSKQESNLGQGQFSYNPSRTFEEKENPANAEEEAANKDTNEETANNLEEIIQYSEETSSTSATTNLSNEGDEVSRESFGGTVDVTEDQTQESNHHLQEYFVEENPDELFSDELINQRNNPETLILKEVAKSVVNHPQGFDSLTDTSFHRQAYDPPNIIAQGVGSALHLDKKEKSRRHVPFKY